MPCLGCDFLHINGIGCHETGCPFAWRDEIRECDWCGNEFKPECERQAFCEEECYRAYFGIEYGLTDEE